MTRTLFYNAKLVTPQEILPAATIWVEEGKIAYVGTQRPDSLEGWQTIDTQGAWLLPAFIDLHIHGAHGFGPEQGTPESLTEMSLALAQQGVGAFCPTLYCAPLKHMAALVRQLLPALGKEKGARILGFHLEGPFISPQKPGVMRPQDIAPTSLAAFEEIYHAAQGHIALVTLAPEVPGIDPVIEFCHQHHIIVQAGHTNATYEQMQAAVKKGVRRVTHWGNAMSGLHQRAPGVLGAALENPAISCEVIADGKHVHPALLALLRRVKPITQITAVTDALLPTGQKEGPFYANGEEVVLQEGVWKRKTDLITAGAALTMPEAFKNLMRAGYSVEQAVACTSTNAARLLGLPEGLQPGSPANMLLLNPQFELQQVWLNGLPL